MKNLMREPETSMMLLGVSITLIVGAGIAMTDDTALMPALIVGGVMVVGGADMAAFQWFRQHRWNEQLREIERKNR